MTVKSNDKSSSKDSEKTPVGAALDAGKKVAGPLANTAATEKTPFDPDSLPVLDRLARKRAQLQKELEELEELQRVELEKEAATAFVSVMQSIERFADYFTPRQKSEIVTALGVTAASGKKTSATGTKVVPKYQLPHIDKTWSGRGKMPKEFAAWMETAAYKDWIKAHPDQKFPPYKGY